MASFVNAGDALAAAVEIERRGRAFYEKASAAAKNGQDKDFFEFMASEEAAHEGIFSGMLRAYGGTDVPAGATDEEYLGYVKALLDSHILFMPEEELAALKCPLRQAMQFEKDTLVFFLALADMVPPSEKGRVLALAEEERKHLRMLAARSAGKC